MACTLKDVAQLAGVSTVTASRVMNGVGLVSDDTRTKVLSAISRLGYSPDVHAVELRRGKGSNSRKPGISNLSPVRAATASPSDLSAKAHNPRRKAESVRLLEEENARLKRLVRRLNMDVEVWRNIAQ
jgi:transcriptional regulator with XRE-family HTH domain